MSGSQSWNRLPKVAHVREINQESRLDAVPRLASDERCIPFGNGRSYSDVCLNDGGVLVRTQRMDRFISFDRVTGVIECEGGVLLSDILNLVIPFGWFLPVTPGTRFASVAGAVANDVHGKNHHAAGSFGHHVISFDLLRSDGTRTRCAADASGDLFRATIGGLGLTGLIASVRLQLAPIANAFIATQTYKFSRLSDFWALNAQAEKDWPYTVAWIDCTSPRGRGILFCGRHAPPQVKYPSFHERDRSFPVDLPISLVNSLSLRAFNVAYYHRPIPTGVALTHYAPYFYPLDAIREWNRLYGRKGFYQYQCVIPPDVAPEGIAAVLSRVLKSGSGSFLSVLKTFGARPSLGMLSFPRPGATLALDFPNHGEDTLRLFASLDDIVRDYGGALYPAKDARMPASMFRAGYPQAEAFSTFIDPKFSSSFWRRVMEI
jgi:FAD/FMN-containing dehydrogenase